MTIGLLRFDLDPSNAKMAGKVGLAGWVACEGLVGIKWVLEVCVWQGRQGMGRGAEEGGG